MFLSTYFSQIRDWFVIPEIGILVEKIPPFEIIKLNLESNPRYAGKKLWGFRPTSMINKIIVHQELGEGDTFFVHSYHISQTSHLKVGGAPKIAYHFTIEKDGQTFQVNELTDVTWHTKGENLSGVGIMLVGDFDGVDHIGKSKPTDDQLSSLGHLLDKLTLELNIPKTGVYGHNDFGKEVCPGFAVIEYLNNYRG